MSSEETSGTQNLCNKNSQADALAQVVPNFHQFLLLKRGGKVKRKEGASLLSLSKQPSSSSSSSLEDQRNESNQQAQEIDSSQISSCCLNESSNQFRESKFPQIKVNDDSLKQSAPFEKLNSISNIPSSNMPQTIYLLDQVKKISILRPYKSGGVCTCEKDRNISCQNCIFKNPSLPSTSIPLNLFDPSETEVTEGKIHLTNIDSTPRTPSTLNNGSNSMSSRNQLLLNGTQIYKGGNPNFSSFHLLENQEQNNKTLYSSKQEILSEKEKEIDKKKENNKQNEVPKTIDLKNQSVQKKQESLPQIKTEDCERNECKKQENTQQNQQTEPIKQIKQLPNSNELKVSEKEQITNLKAHQEDNQSKKKINIKIISQDFKELCVKSAFSQINVGQDDSKEIRSHTLIPAGTHLQVPVSPQGNLSPKVESDQIHKKSYSSSYGKSQVNIKSKSRSMSNGKLFSTSNQRYSSPSFSNTRSHLQFGYTDRPSFFQQYEQDMSIVNQSYVDFNYQDDQNNKNISKECREILVQLCTGKTSNFIDKNKNKNQIKKVIQSLRKREPMLKQIISIVQFPLYTQYISIPLRFTFNQRLFLKQQVIHKIKSIDNNHMIAFVEKKIEQSIFFKIIKYVYNTFHKSLFYSLIYLVVSLICLIAQIWINNGNQILDQIILFLILIFNIVFLFLFNSLQHLQRSQTSAIVFAITSLSQIILIISQQLLHPQEQLLVFSIIRMIHIFSQIAQAFQQYQMCKAAQHFHLCFKISSFSSPPLLPPPPLPPPSNQKL